MGYIGTALLALVFLALGALVQYVQVLAEMVGGKYVAQLIGMYAATIGGLGERINCVDCFPLYVRYNTYCY